MEMGGPTSFEDLVEYLQHIGMDDINHTRGAYLVHAACVYRDLKDWVVRKRSVTLASSFYLRNRKLSKLYAPSGKTQLN